LVVGSLIFLGTMKIDNMIQDYDRNKLPLDSLYDNKFIFLIKINENHSCPTKYLVWK